MLLCYFVVPLIMDSILYTHTHTHIEERDGGWGGDERDERERERQTDKIPWWKQPVVII